VDWIFLDETASFRNQLGRTNYQYVSFRYTKLIFSSTTCLI